MGKASKVLIKTKKFLLTKHTNQKNKAYYYTIRVQTWRMNGDNVMDKVRLHFDPNHVRGGNFAVTWKFKRRKTAEELLTLAILKWGE